MKEPRKQSKDFEQRLLGRLRAVVDERALAATDDAPGSAPTGPRRRRPLGIAIAAAVVIAVVAVLLTVGSGGDGTSRAFAVEPLSGGGVAIKVYGLEDSKGLEAALEKAGIRSQIDWLEPLTTCRERHLKPATVRSSDGGPVGGFTIGGPSPALTIGVMSADQYRQARRAYEQGVRAGTKPSPTLPNLSLDPRSFDAGQTVVIVGSPEPHGGNPEGGYRASVQVVEGPVPPCTPVPEAAGSIGAIRLPAGAEGSGASAGAVGAPKAGQLLFTRTKVVQLETWEPGGPGTGPKDHPRHFTSRNPGPNGHVALVPTTKEVWTAPDGKTRVRETLGRIRFLAAGDQRLWEEAGSPPPFEYDPVEHHVTKDAAGSATKEYAGRDFRGRHAFANVPKLAALPTEPEALRAAIEGTPAGTAPSRADSENGRTTAERLLEILTEPTASAALRSAAFSALGEIPGVRHEADVVDAAGRHGEALDLENEEGFGRRVIFDPRSSQVLAESEVIFGAPATRNYGAPAGTPYRETAYLGSRIVN